MQEEKQGNYFLKFSSSGTTMDGENGMKLFAMSDVHGDLRHFDAAATLMESADAVVLSGDLMRACSVRSAERVLARVEAHAKRIIAVPGNWDRDEVRLLLDERGYGVHGRGRIIDNIGFFGVGGSGHGPVRTGDGSVRRNIRDVLEEGYAQVEGAAHTILVTHAPPRGFVDRSFIGLRGGSRAVRDFIGFRRVDICLSGHIHEAFGVDRFNGCVVANSGSFKEGRYSLVEVRDAITVTQGAV